MNSARSVIGMIDLREYEFYDILYALHHFQVVDGKLKYSPSSLTDKQRWSFLKKLNKKLVNAKGVKVI